MDVNVAIGNGQVTGSLMAYSYPTQTITLTCLNSGTTYNYCVVATDATNVVQVGEPVCGSFTTRNIISDNSDGMYIAKYHRAIYFQGSKILSMYVLDIFTEP